MTALRRIAWRSGDCWRRETREGRKESLADRRRGGGKEKGGKSIREKEAGKERGGIHPEYKGTSVRFGLRKSKAFQEPGCWITQPTFHHLAEYSLLPTAKVKIAGFIVGIYATERETRPSQCATCSTACDRAGSVHFTRPLTCFDERRRMKWAARGSGRDCTKM